jgi:MOSC domain-containing protein YiiM
MTGQLLGIARRVVSRAPMETLTRAKITTASGLAGDCKGLRFPERQITILSEEAWRETNVLLSNSDLDWTTRRANLLVSGVRLPRGIGSRLAIGAVVLEVTGQTSPCRQMDLAFDGLRKALAGDWRGGITCKVVCDGEIALADPVGVLRDVPERIIRLPD